MAAAKETLTPPTIGFTNDWTINAGGAPGAAYSKWPWMQLQPLQAVQMLWMMPFGGGSIPSQMP